MRARLTPPRAAVLALAASALAHVALLGGERERPTAAPATPAVTLLGLPPPMAMPEPMPAPLPALHTRAPQPAPPRAAPPAAEVVVAAAAPLLRLSGPAVWRYRLRQGGQDGEALLEWQPEADGRYALRLTRRVGERALPALQSLGRTGSTGLAPERFALQRGGQDRQAVNFDTAGRRLSFSASPARLELPEGTQDRLSWWLQLAALVQAAPATGGPWRIWVAGLRGELREWVFETVATGPGDAGRLHLRRQTLGPHDPGVELWMDPARGYWPVRLRHGDPAHQGYEIELTDVNS